MKKLSVVIASAFVLVGCVAVEPTNVSYPVQTEENVQNTEQSEQDFQESETNSEIVESVQEDVQLSESEASPSVIESTSAPEPVEQGNSRERAEYDENVIIDAPNVEEFARTRTMFEVGCESFNAGTLNHKYLENYREILDDICSDFRMDYSLVEVISSPRVDEDSLELYVNNNVFGLSYWDKYVNGGLSPLKMVVLMEEEQDWWNQQLDGLLNVAPEWFGPTDGGGHCYAADSEAFCPKAYWDYYNETAVNQNVLATMLGSKMDWNTFRKVVPIHEATHQFHITEGLGHWRWWYMEGQATYFELSSTVLVPGLGASSWRDQIQSSSNRRDRTKFTATTIAETVAHMSECNTSGTCDGFRYFAGSLAHELLVNTYGVDSYINWNLAIARELPDFKWYGMSESVRQLGNAQFSELFLEYFGINIDTWEQTELAAYILGIYG